MGVRAGALLSLVGDEQRERMWEVVRAYGPRLEQPPDSRWRVGGLL